MAWVELVAIGDELLLGDTVDTNAAWIGRRLAEVGVRVRHRATVGDDVDAIAEAIRAAHARTGVVICTGGLGPTRDDLTRDALAQVHSAPLESRDEWLVELRRRYHVRGLPMPESNRVQALVPRGGALLPNSRGTAPGIAMVSRQGRGTTIALPGVPGEMRGLMDDHVVALLQDLLRPETPVRSWLLRTTGISEAALAERVDDVASAVAGDPRFTLAFLPGTHGVDLRLTSDSPRAEGPAITLLTDLRERLGVHVYAEERADLAAVVGALLSERGLKLAVAESCTGGLVSKRLTDEPGSSAFMMASFVTYSNEAKQRHLGVSSETLQQHGAVSEACAREMAEGARDAGGADVAISITGLAGPGGGSDAKPVGLVWFGLARPDGATATHRVVLPGERDDIRQRAAQTALDMVRRSLIGAL